MSDKEKRNDPLFLRNSFESRGKWGIPLVRKQEIDLSSVSLIACSDTRNNDTEANRKKGVHFFVDDYRFTATYTRPEQSLAKYSQYTFLLTPDFSAYNEMPVWRQIESIAQSRWVGAYWQYKGQTVIPTITWSTASSFEFCFDGVEQNAIVAVSTVGCMGCKTAFMRGYQAMLERLQPEAIICYGKPMPEMRGNVIVVEYRWNERRENGRTRNLCEGQ